MITLDDEWAIDANSSQFMLCKRKFNKKKEEYYWFTVGYYSSLETLMHGLYERKCYEAVTKVETLEEMLDNVKTYFDNLKIETAKEAVETTQEEYDNNKKRENLQIT